MEIFESAIVYLKVKETSPFRMIESQLWHNKTKIKNVKAAKMVGLIKNCHQYSQKLVIFSDP